LENRFRFFTPIQVRAVETDLQEHVFFCRCFTYLDIGSIEYLRTAGYNYNDFLSKGVNFFKDTRDPVRVPERFRKAIADF